MNATSSSVSKPLLILAATVVILGAVKILASFFAPLFLALLFAFVLSPLHSWLRARGAPRALAVLATIALYILILIFLAWVLSAAVTEIGAILQNEGGKAAANGEAAIQQVQAWPVVGPAWDSAAKMLDPAQLGNLAAGLAKGLAGLLSNLLVTSLLFIFIVIELPVIMRRLRETYGSDHPIPVRAGAAVDLTAHFFVLRTLVNLVTGLGIFVVCILMGIPSAALWGLMVFILSYIPYIGIFIACVPPSLLALANGGVPYMLLFILLVIIVNGLAEQVLSPLITGRGLRISPTLVFLSFMLWGFILGGPGFIVAVPLTVGLLLFFGAFDETKGLVAAVSNIPVPEPVPDARRSE